MDVQLVQEVVGKAVLFNNNFMTTDTLLIIFTRNPDLGKVKTRLANRIGPEKALEVYQILLKKTATVTQAISTDKWVYYTPMILEEDLWDTAYFDKKVQQGKDLGERMRNAFMDGFSAGYKRVVLIGSDLYQLAPRDLEMAFEKLLNHELGFGPATHGGYYLIGLKRIFPDIVKNKEWGDNTVLRDTLQPFKSHDVALLNQYNDIDIYDDLKQHQVFQKYLKQYE